MNSTKLSIQTEIQILDQINTFEKLEYFLSLDKQCVSTFLLGVYNITSLLRDYTMLIATNLTKCVTTTQTNILVNILYSINCVHGRNKIENYVEYLKQFKSDKTYISEDYYKKNSITFAVDKICNDLCKVTLDKSLYMCALSFATIECILGFLNKKFNAYAKSHVGENAFLLSESYYIASSFLELLDDTVTNDEIIAGIADTIKIFSSFFSDLSKLFHCDSQKNEF
jgi:hypothetical protein